MWNMNTDEREFENEWNQPMPLMKQDVRIGHSAGGVLSPRSERLAASLASESNRQRGNGRTTLDRVRASGLAKR